MKTKQPSVYIETSIVSYLTAHDSSSLLGAASVAWMKRSEIQESAVRPDRTLQESRLTLAPYVKNVKDNKRALRIDVFWNYHQDVSQ